MKNVIHFLHWKFRNSDMQPLSLTAWRSALKWAVNSSFHPVIDNILVTRYIAGLFNLYPVKPQMPLEIWDINIVLAYWDKQPPNQDLPLMLLTQKAVLLLLISTMRRRCELLSIHIDNIVYRPNCMIFPLESYPKTYSIHNKFESLCFLTVQRFNENSHICPLLTIQHYIHRTKAIRNHREKRVFLTTQNPFRAAAPMTIRRWILSGLFQAGIDVDKYSAKTTHHANSSKAYFAGVNVDFLLKRAGWVNISSFVLHYNLPIEQSSHPGKSVNKPSFPHSSKLPSYHNKLLHKSNTNIRASQLLQAARKQMFCTSTVFCATPFISPPPRVVRKILPAKTRVEIPVATTNRRGKFTWRRKPYVTYTASVPSTSGVKTTSQVPSAASVDPTVNKDASLSSTE